MQWIRIDMVWYHPPTNWFLCTQQRKVNDSQCPRKVICRKRKFLESIKKERADLAINRARNRTTTVECHRAYVFDRLTSCCIYRWVTISCYLAYFVYSPRWERVFFFRNKLKTARIPVYTLWGSLDGCWLVGAASHTKIPLGREMT